MELLVLIKFGLKESVEKTSERTYLMKSVLITAENNMNKKLCRIIFV